MKQAGFFDLSDHLRRLSSAGDPLEELQRVIDFEVFRPVLEDALCYSDGTKGGRPPYDPVSMFKALILAARNNVSDERMEFLIRDRLSWLRFLGFDLGKPTPDENTIRAFRERLTDAGAIKALFDAFDLKLRSAGYLPMGGQIVDATLVSAPKQRNTNEQKAQIKAGKSARDIWPDAPNTAAQKDVDARWTVKFSKARHDGKLLRTIVTSDNTASDVWADTAYRSKANEAYLAKHGWVSRIHFKKPKGKPMPDNIRRGNAAKSKIRAYVEHVFGQQKSQMGLVYPNHRHHSR